MNEDEKYLYVPKSDEQIRVEVRSIKGHRLPKTVEDARELLWHKLLISNKEFTLY